MPSVAGGNGLEWPQPMNGASTMISTMSSPPQTAEQANLWMGIRSEPVPHEISSQHPNETCQISAFPSKSIPSVVVRFCRREKVTALEAGPCRTRLQAEVGRIRLSLFWESRI